MGGGAAAAPGISGYDPVQTACEGLYHDGSGRAAQGNLPGAAGKEEISSGAGGECRSAPAVRGI